MAIVLRPITAVFRTVATAKCARQCPEPEHNPNIIYIMKYSQFNTIVLQNENYVLFNALTQRFIFIMPEIKELLNAAIHEGIDLLQQCHPDFYGYLVEQEFIVDNSIDEVERVRQLSKSVDEDESLFLLTINPTMNCNFKCWYCYETRVKKSKLDASSIGRINTFITRTLINEKIKEFNLSFFGGEPLLYFKNSVVPIIDHYLSECTGKVVQGNIGFTSNGYLIDDYFLDYFLERNFRCGLQITLDGARDEHDLVRYVSSQKGSYSKILENTKRLAENGFFVRLRINYTSRNAESTLSIIDDFEDLSKEAKDKFLVVDFHKVWQESKTPEMEGTIQTTIEEFSKRGF